ncbi:MAG: ABC transporter permease [Mycobacteriales bacterium]
MTPGTGSAEALGLVGQVAGREIRTRLKERGFYISTAIAVLAIVALVLISQAVGGGKKTFSVGVVGKSATTLIQTLPAIGESTDITVKVTSYDDLDAARAAVDDDTVKAAVVNNATIVSKSDVDHTLRGILEAAHRQLSSLQQLRRSGLSPDQAARALTVAPMKVDRTRSGNADQNTRKAVAYFGTILLYGQLIMYGMWVAMGIVEEKSSRVVELLLAALRPWQLLAGKIIGIGLVGLVQILTIGIAGIGVGIGSGAIDVPSTVITTVVDVVVWFILGYAFYACAFAAAGSLASRQEDLQNVTAPLSLLLVGSFFVALATLNSPGSTLAHVASVVPPLSAMTLPSRAAQGEVSLLTYGFALVLMAVAIVLLVGLASRIYSRAVLHTGARLSWRQAFALREKVG